MTTDITRTIRENEQFLRHVLEIAGLGTYVMDVPGNSFKTSHILDEIFGLPDDYPRTFDGWVAILHPDDRQMMVDYFIQEVVERRQRFDKEYRIIRPLDGTERWLHGYGDLTLDADGKPLVMTGTIQDITERKRSEKALQQSESRYRELIDLAVDGILVGSHEGIIIEANRFMCELSGLSREELVGRHIRDVLFTPESLAQTPLRFDLLNEGKTVVSERQIIRANGKRAFIEMRTKMMPDGTYQSIYRDITDRKDAETTLFNFAETLAQRVEERTRELEAANTSLKQTVQQLRTSQVLLTEMGRMAKVGGWELEINSWKQIWTEEVYHIHEVDLDFEPTGEKGISFYAPSARPVVVHAVQRCIEHGEPYDLELQFITAKGKLRWVHAIGKADLEHGRIHGTFQDVTDHKLAEDALREKNAALDQSVAQLRQLAMELTQAEENERKRLAAILHDDVQQYIAAATMKISLLKSRMPAGEHTRGVQESLTLLGDALNASRSLTASLCPPVLHEAGLLPGLRWLAEWMEKTHGLAVKVTGDESVPVPPPLCILSFQAVRELLFNIVKHAGVDKASVMLDQPDAQRLQIVVMDHGKGFAPTDLQAHLLTGGFGLFHLKERLTHVGGTLEVESKSARGTRVSITVPLS